MKKLAIVCLLVVAGAIKSFGQTKIEAKDAGKHINETVTLCEKVVDGKFFDNSQTTLLNIGAAHPNELLTLVIKGDDRKKFSGDPEKIFMNQKVCITGKFIDYKGKPEIIITDAEQLKLDKN
ncbi:hypothetical protein [Mucilaginibacter agri]|uniref:DNA-binding protein n=1 Tax=Mucilaginibacter agri TaxID=2695265 RepID=A0A966DV82_9SPHI|nr:hypothetical protein [Mucilaginibacter agri]NCD71197.1 hypothetical protein [Mucilaginibacter agri]